MVICGLKLTHDGCICIIDNGKLIFSIEMEKIKNNKRFTAIEDTNTIFEILEDNNYGPDKIDIFAVDGWGGYDEKALAKQPRLEIGENYNFLDINSNHVKMQIPIARYREEKLNENVLHYHQFDGLVINNKNYKYHSYPHAAGHIMSAYCTSPFAERKEDSYILIWDGGMYPRLYYFDYENNKVENFGPLFLLIGNIYTIFSQHFGPFKVDGTFAKDDLSVAGKVMAYIAKGSLKKELFELFDDIYSSNYRNPMGFANLMANEFKSRIDPAVYSDEDILNTFHHYLEDLLIRKLEKKIKRFPRKSKNLCLAGGCALNIKWNSSIRNTGLFQDVYVPPFPNDSGNALGVACCAMFNLTKQNALDWNVYSGPDIIKNKPLNGWSSRDFSTKELAGLLYESNEPVVVLSERAELGPRALGNRSILASPCSIQMKDVLNEIKIREPYRPISPICLEDKSSLIFKPGKKDPYMLFDHDVKDDWKDKIPAICHLDGSARLQTVNSEMNQILFNILSEFYNVSGIPVLCNTSANRKGIGFFPDIDSVMEWGRVNYIWNDGKLYEKDSKVEFLNAK